MSVSDNPFIVLGVSPNASAEEIQTAFRKLAKKHHPDLHPGDPKAGEQFARISAAYDLLGDPDKRARFDRGEIDASGVEKPAQRFYRDFAASGDDHPYASTAGFEDFAGGDDILAELMRRGRRTTIRMRGADLHLRLSLDFLEAVNGATKRIVLSNGERLDFTVPAGSQNGQMVRLRGKGEPGLGGAPAGDALVELEVRPHPRFKRDGDDIRFELPISLTEAVLGAQIKIPTPTGPVTMSVPKRSNSGKVLRLRGRGVPRSDQSRGDMYVELKVILPDCDPHLEEFVESWSAGHSYNPRQNMET